MTVKVTNWATRTKEAAANTTPSIPQGMTPVGGQKEGILAFYRFTQPKDGSTNQRQLIAGDEFEGTYQGYLDSKNYPGNLTHKVKTAEGIVGLPNCKQLNDDLSGLAVGSKVYVAYKGQESIKTGKYAGKQRHAFVVATELSAS